MSGRKTENYQIRPAGRHILTIGRDLIQNKYAAVTELVKNAYDADSPDVSITFDKLRNQNGIQITIEDHGHGMSKDTVVNKWLVLSTDDKLKRRTSPKGRVMQGQKGIGRYAASLLGNELRLETITSDGEMTTINMDWEKLAKAEYLDQIDIEVETLRTKKPSGTKIIIKGGRNYFEEWSKDDPINPNKNEFTNLKSELKKLVLPVSSMLNSESPDKFDILLTIQGFGDQKDVSAERIEPYPILGLYDYRIYGTINPDGKGTLTYSNQKAKNTVREPIDFDYGKSSGCGKLIIDISVFDREADSIALLIERGLKDESGNYLGKNEARRLLNDYNGIGVFRNGFRIRPLGDSDFDWLKLNKQRIQNPSMKIGSNQVIGYILIQSETDSGLKEKSARDGLKENKAYENLKTIVGKVINELETRRFKYRTKAGLSRTAGKIEHKIEKLFDYDKVKSGIRKKLSFKGVDKVTTDEIINIIENKEKETNEIAQDISRAVAIYQGQATLGKIINVVLHEGRRPLSFFKNQVDNIKFWADELKESYNEDALNEMLSIVDRFETNADMLAGFFKRLDHLAAAKRGKKNRIDLKHEIKSCFMVFEKEMENGRILYEINCPKQLSIDAWIQDFYSIFTNLIDNSIYWLNEKNPDKKKIQVDIQADGNTLAMIDYKDTGPGIDKQFIEDDLVFVPGFTTRPQGTGIGLAIAGEAATRNKLTLKVLESEDGAHFRLEPAMEEQDG